MHKAFPLPGESSHWQYMFPLPVEGVPTARRMEILLPRVCTAMMKKLPVKDRWHYIKYALTINPYIYVSCIKQFWNTVVVIQTNDVTRLQALVDKKKVMITEATIRDALRLDDAEGVDYVPNEEIFAELARMGYEKPLTKLTFYRLSSQVSGSRKFSFSKYIFESLVRNVDSSSKFYMYPRFIHLIIKNQLGVIEEEDAAEEQVPDIAVDDATAYEVDTTVQEDAAQEPSIPSPTPPPHPPQDLPSPSQVQHSPPQSPQAQPQTQSQSQQATDFPMSRLQEALDAYAALTRRVEHLEYDKVAQDLEIKKLKRRVKKLEKGNKIKVSKLRRLQNVRTSQRIDTSDDTEKNKAEDDKVAGNDQVQGRQAKIYKIDMDHASKVLSMQEDDPEVQEVVDVVTTAKLITKSKDKGKGIMVQEPKPLKKKQQVEMDEEYARKLHKELNKDIDWDVAIDHVKQKSKEDPFVQRYQVIKKSPQTEAQARRNMIMYLKNVVGFRLDYFKGMSYDDIRPIFEANFNSNMEFLLKRKEQLEEEDNRAIESINETLAQKAAKRRKLNEEVEDLKRHLEIVPDEDDDVYTEATPLAKKVPVMDYKIIQLNNKPHYKIIRANRTHQLYISFLTLLKNFDREDLESLWSLVKERWTRSSLKESKDCPWSSKVERRYPLSRFTLDRMLNAVRLRVEEQSEMYLELLSAVKQKLMMLDNAAERRLMLLSQVKTVNDKRYC
nr:hypothetical protein [Tanacetum cinerariifolium]